MAKYLVKLRIDAVNINVAKKMMAQYPQLTPHVEKIEKSPSRADRLSEAEELVSDAKNIVEELKSEMEDWHSNLNEGLQQTSQGQAVEEAEQALDELYGELENIDFGNVTFPGMFGG